MEYAWGDSLKWHGDIYEVEKLTKLSPWPSHEEQHAEEEITLDKATEAQKKLGMALVKIEDHIKQLNSLGDVVRSLEDAGFWVDLHGDSTTQMKEAGHEIKQRVQQWHFRFQYLKERGKNQLSVLYNIINRYDTASSISIAQSARKDRYDWMAYLEEKGQHLTKTATRAVLHNWDLGHYGRNPEIDYANHRVEVAFEFSHMALAPDPIDPSQAFQVLAQMPDLTELSLDGFEDSFAYRMFDYQSISIAAATGRCWPVLSSVQTLTLSPDFGSAMFSDALHALLIRCCPSAKALRINIRENAWGLGRRFWDSMPSALEEASRLTQLVDLQIVRFGYFATVGMTKKCMFEVQQYFPKITRLSLYGNIDIPSVDDSLEDSYEADESGETDESDDPDGPYKIKDFAIKFKAFDKLEQIVMTDEPMMPSRGLQD
ncbi:hypothetical protein QBC41DRAFT_304715 [Cercophora samala]|uniref:Uncharacterized protein n=1 Tax=Cercophora samala TaxID=330535 RepID=A0AA39ZA55_9PEZI|nr:hypothetical protein QBC41DRAFT_304715 [Cercophora samala]